MKSTVNDLNKQVIVSMNGDNTNKFMLHSSDHITNINRLLKNIKSNYKTDYIRAKKSGIIIITNKVALSLDFQTLENYVKNANQINTDKVKTPCLPQSKSYLKLISLPYYAENTNLPISSDDIEKVLKNNHIFNDISFASYLRIIKVPPKLDMAIIWINIWDSQSGTNAKLINCSFNIEKFIATVYGAYMNLGIS